MTKQQHPIIPPPELVQEWCLLPLSQDEVLVIAAQWGADQELEACCEFLDARHASFVSRDLRAARRPKPPSLKQQALALIDECTYPECDYLDDNVLSIIRRTQLITESTIRRALEALPDD